MNPPPAHARPAPARSAVEDVTAETARPVHRPWLVQSWRDLAFLHWPVDPAVVAPLLPPGTYPDTLDGVTYVGLIGFRMVGLGLLRGPGIPYLGTFCETNVRLYSVDGQGRRAVVFRSLDASRLLPVLTARATLRLPYMWSRMRLTRDGDVFTYTASRLWPRRAPAVRAGPPLRSRARGSLRDGRASAVSAGTPEPVHNAFAVRAGAPIAQPTALEHFLTARWGLHTRAWGRTLHLPNEHPRWPLHRATLLSLDDDLVTAAGLPAPAGPPVSVLYSPGVPVVFGRPSIVLP